MRSAIAVPLLTVLLLALPARGQIVLPGAVAPTPEGQSATPAEAPKPARPKPKRKAAVESLPTTPAPSKTVPSTSLAGQTYYLDGREAHIGFTMRDRALVVSQLSLVGRTEKGAECRIDVADLPLATTEQGSPDGVARIGIAFPACPISFDVLDGAVLGSAPPGSCAFQATHCAVDPAGLWGPQPATLGPDRDKAIERERARAEAAMRANFKRLVSTTKDRPTIVGYARDQAQFSSTREEVCRAYAGETKHGFCATRLTEARAESLKAQADAGQIEKDKRKKAKRKA